MVKNGLATGTTVGRVNGLDSFTRVYPEDRIEQTFAEVVLSLDRKWGAFSTPGDSAAIVLERGVVIVGMLTGGGRATEETDTTYLTPYCGSMSRLGRPFPAPTLRRCPVDGELDVQWVPQRAPKRTPQRALQWTISLFCRLVRLISSLFLARCYNNASFVPRFPTPTL